MSIQILVTGAAGFIGSHVCETFLKKKFTVVGIDNIDKKFNLSFARKHKNFEFYKINILNELKLSDLIKTHHFAFVIHCAGKAGVRESVEHPLIYTKTNVLGCHTLLDVIKQHSPKTKLILSSSASIYGVQKKAPFSEDLLPNPKCLYGATKLSMELLVRQYHMLYGLKVAIVRPFSVYGPRGRLDMAPFLVINAAEKGKRFTQFGTNKDNRRDWTYIDDLIQGLVMIVDRFDFKTFEVFNLGNGDPIGIDDFIKTSQQMLGRYLNKKLIVDYAPRGMEESPITYADIGKMRRMFGFAPNFDFKQGLELFYQFYAQHRQHYQKS